MHRGQPTLVSPCLVRASFCVLPALSPLSINRQRLSTGEHQYQYQYQYLATRTTIEPGSTFTSYQLPVTSYQRNISEWAQIPGGDFRLSECDRVCAPQPNVYQFALRSVCVLGLVAAAAPFSSLGFSPPPNGTTVIQL